MNIDLVDIAVSVSRCFIVADCFRILLMLEAKALPKKYRMHGIYRFLVTGACLIVMAFGIYMVDQHLAFGKNGKEIALWQI